MDVQRLEVPATRAVDSVVFLHDNRRLLTQSRGGFVQTWDVLTGSPGIRFEVRGGGLFALAVSPGGRWLVTANWNGDVQLWHVDSGVELASGYGEWDSVFTLKCSTGGRVIAVADVSRVFVWDFSPEIGAFSNDAKEAPIVLVAAALSSGVGTLLDHEREDFIFRDTPRDLSHILAGMMMAEQRSQVAPTARTLRADRSSASYRNTALRHPDAGARSAHQASGAGPAID
jgi:hypothetical protein